MRPTFEAPRILGQLDVRVFAAIRQAMKGTIARADFVIHEGRATRPDDQALVTSLEPLHQLYREEFGGTKDVHCSIDTRDVRRHDHQRNGASDWHLDTSPGLQVCDALPTEFLINSSSVLAEQRLHRNVALDRWGNTGTLPYTDDEVIHSFGCQIYRAQPREVLAFTGQYHRSPRNEGNKRVARTWIRMTMGA